MRKKDGRRKESFNVGFRNMRIKAGKTQKQVADYFGMWSTGVSNWETGKAYPPADILVELAKLYKCSVDDLLKVEYYKGVI